MGDMALGEALGTSATEASMLATKFRNSYPGVQSFIEQCVANCRAKGYIKNLHGRVRYLPDINSKNSALRSNLPFICFET